MTHLADTRITQFTTLSDEIVSAITDILERHTEYKYDDLAEGSEAYLDFKQKCAHYHVEAIVDMWRDTHAEYQAAE